MVFKPFTTSQKLGKELVITIGPSVPGIGSIYPFRSYYTGLNCLSLSANPLMVTDHTSTQPYILLLNVSP